MESFGIDSIRKMAAASVSSQLVLGVLTIAPFMNPCAALGQPKMQGTPAVVGIEQLATSINVRLTEGVLRIQPCAANVARITFALHPTATEPESLFLAKAPCPKTPFHVEETSASVFIRMPNLTVEVERGSGAVHFKDALGNLLLKENDFPRPRQLKPVVTDQENTNRASVWFGLTPEEKFYGLGQHQNGLLDFRNVELELSQDNTNISIPFFLSSKGYGVFWNNASVTRWNNRFQPVLNISSSVAESVDYFFINGPSFDSIITQYRRLTGDAPLFPLWAYGFWQCKLAYASRQELLGVADKYRALHIPIDNLVIDEGWETRLGSHIFIDQYPDPKSMVQQLHDNHYHLMVSIWPIFHPGSANYDEYKKSGLFIGDSVNHTPPEVPGTGLYDAFNSKGRELYWQQAKKSLFDIGVDAFWLDSSEPEDDYGEEQGSMLAGAQTAIGNGSRYSNLFPFMTTSAIYDGQRSTTDRKRVFMLTRSAFAGQQHHAAAAWSGDIATNFETLKRQIPAGLNYSMTGLPYWTTDIGGFNGGDTSDPAYQEVFVRWFQYGSFCPIFRVHGVRANKQNELWSYGEKAQQILTLYDRLRYRLLPYTYSLAARTTFDSYTPMRALAFDFREDKKALEIRDEFLYGESILVAPVTDAGATSREIYLPAGPAGPAGSTANDWYDFWTGERTAGAQTIARATPFDIMPLYVRAGSIIPMGTETEYTSEHLDAPIELRIYPGKDATFNLYDDDGTSYDYEKGLSSSIFFKWDDQAKVLTLGERHGKYTGMLANRTFSLVMVDASHGVGEAETSATKTVNYDGHAQQVTFQ